MLSPEIIAQKFNTVLSEPERVQMAQALTPELTALFIKMFGQEYAGILQRLDNYKTRIAGAATGPSRTPGSQLALRPDAASGTIPPRPVSRLASVTV